MGECLRQRRIQGSSSTDCPMPRAEVGRTSRQCRLVQPAGPRADLCVRPPAQVGRHGIVGRARSGGRDGRKIKPRAGRGGAGGAVRESVPTDHARTRNSVQIDNRQQHFQETPAMGCWIINSTRARDRGSLFGNRVVLLLENERTRIVPWNEQTKKTSKKEWVLKNDPRLQKSYSKVT